MIEFIKSFEGIIGTVIGVLLGSLISFFSKKYGRISYFVNSIEIRFEKNIDGSIEKMPLDIETQYASLKLDIDIYNSSDSIKVIRDIKLRFESKTNNFTKDISDLSTERRSNVFVNYDKLKHINLFPQVNDNYELKVYFDPEEIPTFISNNYSVYFVGKKPRFIFSKSKIFLGNIINGEVKNRI